MPPRALGRRRPTDNVHAERYPLTASTLPRKPTPVVIGSNWYTGMDSPREDRPKRWWVEPTGVVRGGHAYCLKPPDVHDRPEWWAHYDQGEEGACVSFASMRMMTLLNRVRYNPWLAYTWMRANDEYPDDPPIPGTSVRAGMDFLRKVGPCRETSTRIWEPDPEHGILENRWCTSVEQIAYCLDPASDGQRVLNMGYVVVLNSWGQEYRHHTRMSLETLNRLVFDEDGEATLASDR